MLASTARRLPSLVAWAVACVVLIVVVSGCGSRDSSGSAHDRLSKHAYIERAGALQDDAAEVFRTLDGKLPATKAKAAPRLAALDQLIAGYEKLRPPRAWQEFHDEIVVALKDMRRALKFVSTLSAQRRAAIARHVRRYQAAQARYEAAIRSINATR